MSTIARRAAGVSRAQSSRSPRCSGSSGRGGDPDPAAPLEPGPLRAAGGRGERASLPKSTTRERCSAPVAPSLLIPSKEEVVGEVVVEVEGVVVGRALRWAADWLANNRLAARRIASASCGETTVFSDRFEPLK